MEQTQEHVYPLLEYVNRAWRVSRVFTREEDLNAAGASVLSDFDLALCISYGQKSKLVSPEKLESVAELQKKLHDLKLTLDAASDSIKQKDLQLDAMHFVWGPGTLPGATHKWTPGDPPDDVIRAAASQATRLSAWWLDKHGEELKSDSAVQFSGGQIDAALTATATREERSKLRAELDAAKKRSSMLAYALGTSVIAMVVERVLHYVF